MAKKKDNFVQKGKDYFKSEKLRNREERFIAQCFLLSNLDRYVGVGTYGRTNILPVDGDPSVFMGKIISRSKMERFLEQVTPAELSALVPKVRIFKVEKNNITNGFREVELHFDDYTSQEDLSKITKSRFGRGSGVGLKGCTISYIGENPASSTRMINVELKLFFSKVEDLMRGQAGQISFIDLIRENRQKRTTRTDQSILADREHKIRLEVGWAIPPSSHRLFQNKKELREAIADTTLSLNLVVLQHNLAFEQDGRVTMDISFVGSIENEMRSSVFNIFPDDTSGDPAGRKTAVIKYLEEERGKKNKALKKLKLQIGKSSGNKKQVREFTAKRKKLLTEYEKLLDKLKSLKTQERIFRYESIIRTLFNANKVWVDSVSKDFLGVADNKTRAVQYKVDDYLQYSATSNKSVCRSTPRISPSERQRRLLISKKIKFTNEQFVKNISKKAKLTSSARSNCIDIYYVFLGDILDVVLNKFYDTSDTERYRPENVYYKFLIGDVVRRDNPSKRVNLADIPISLDYFAVWFANSVTRRTLDEYGFNEFVGDLIGKLVDPIMNLKCLRDSSSTETKITPRLHQFFIPADGVVSNQKDPLFGLTNSNFLKIAGNYKPGKKKIPTLSPVSVDAIKSDRSGALKKSKNTSVYSYLFITGNEEVKNYRTVNYLRDVREGVYHFNLGADTGLTKRIDFEQNNIKYQAESLAQGSSIAWTKRLYNAKITMYGNTFFVPGMKIYINPMTIGLGRADKGESIASQLGLGGYYRVTNIQHQIQSGQFETVLTCIWESKGNGFGIKTKTNFDNLGTQNGNFVAKRKKV